MAPLVVGGSVAGASAVGHAPRGAPLARRADPAAPAPRRHLCQRAGAAARRARGARERGAHPEPGRAADDRPGGGAPAHRPRAARWRESGACGAVDRLERAREALPEGTAADRATRSPGCRARTVELAEAIRHLSHELHPGVSSTSAWPPRCAAIAAGSSDEHGLTVTFRADDDLGTVPTDVALCLYRVTQEALKNVARHAEASQVGVTVARDGADVALTISDDGRGFDLAEARRRGGLGLISLDERVRLARRTPRRSTPSRSAAPRSASWCHCPRAQDARAPTVLLADDHAIVMEGLASLLAKRVLPRRDRGRRGPAGRGGAAAPPRRHRDRRGHARHERARGTAPAQGGSESPPR